MVSLLVVDASAADPPSGGPALPGAQRLTASLTTEEVEAAGTGSELDGAWQALFFSPDRGRLTLDWTVRASSALVAWERETYVAVGDAARDPNGALYAHRTGSASGEDVYDEVVIRGTVDARYADLLARAHGPAVAGLVRTSGAIGLVQSDAHQWRPGRADDSSVSADALTATHGVAPGVPYVRASDAGGFLFGDLGLVVWGGTIQVASAAGNATYRAGTWWENATAAVVSEKGAARDQYGQLLSLRVANATFEFQQSGGDLEAVLDSVRLQSEGDLLLRGAVGRLESPTHYYELANETVRLHGTYVASFAPARGEPARMEMTSLDARAALDRPATGPLLAGRAATAAGWGGGVLGPATAGLFVVVVLAALVWYVRQSRDPVGAAERALFRRHARLAHWWAQRATRRDRGGVDGWFVAAAALLQQGRDHAVIRWLERAPAHLREGHPSLAFAAAMAHARLGRSEAAVSLLARAVQEPRLRARIQEAPEFEPLLSHPELRHWFATRRGEPAYG